MNITPQRLAGIPMHPVSLAGRRLPRRAQDASLRAVQRLAFRDLATHDPPAELGAFTRIASTEPLRVSAAARSRLGREAVEPGAIIWVAPGL